MSEQQNEQQAAQDAPQADQTPTTDAPQDGDTTGTDTPDTSGQHVSNVTDLPEGAEVDPLTDARPVPVTEDAPNDSNV